MKIFIVTGCSPSASGTQVYAYTSQSGVDRCAASLVNAIKEDSVGELKTRPGAEPNEPSWRAVLNTLQDFYGAAECDIDVTTLTLDELP